MRSLFKRFSKDEGGATAIEYGLICAMICLAVIGALTAFSQSATTVFNTAMAAVNSAFN